MTHMPKLSRRGFIVASAAATGGLALGIRIPDAIGQAGRAATPAPEVTAWVVIEPDDTVIVRVARSEMGQGAMTALPQLVCEELECDWAKVKAEYAPPHENLRRNRVWGQMSTGGSQGTRGSQDYLRKAGATAREMLIAAAAKEWNVPPGECTAKNSVITHAPSGRTTTFGKVASAASQLTPPAEVKLKEPKDWTLIGKPVGRLDLFEKVTGQPIYGIDARPAGVVYAAIAQSPVFGGKVVSWDEGKIRGRRDVLQVVNLGDAVAVVADNTWTAQQALDALPITWDEGANGKVSSATIAEFLKSGLTATDAGVGRKDGDAVAGIAGAAKRVEATYAVPFLAHSCMEPMNCTAHVVGDKVEIWVSTQNGEAALATAASAAGVRPENVIVHKAHQGGGFGRRGAVQDYTAQAVKVAKAVGRPVKLTWSREEDTQHDFYRPIVMSKMTAGLDADGKVVGWHVRISGNSIIGSLLPQNLPADGVDRQFLSGFTQEFGYDVPNYLCDLSMRITHVPVGFWRAVNYTQNTFFRESFVDEMAHAAGKDPYEFRRALLHKSPRDLAVLDAAAKAAGWGTPLPAGVFRGIAEVYGYGSYVANVVEVSVSPAGEFKLHRVVTAVDCGTVANPAICRQQVASGTVYGLTAILYGEITIKDGRVEQSNFHDYEMLRIHEMPKVETVLVPSGGFWGGMGEPTLAPLAPAICNAIFAATGKRIRSLPLKNHDLKKA